MNVRIVDTTCIGIGKQLKSIDWNKMLSSNNKIVLSIDNSECKIEGLNGQQEKELKNLLAYTPNPTANYFSGGYGPKKQYLISKHGVFPTGLLYITLKYLKTKNVSYSVNDIRRVPQPRQGLFKLSLPHTPYESQINAAEACLKGRGIIVAPTGLGKSVIAALIIEKLQVPTLLVVPTLELKRQLGQSLEQYFGKTKHIKVCNIDELDSKKVVDEFDCVIIDEFHHSGAKSYRKLNKIAWSKVYYKFGLTATPFRSQDHERLLLESVLSEVIYKIEYADAVTAGYIVPMEAYYIDLPKNVVTGNTWRAVYSTLVVNNEARNNIIQQFLLKFHAEKLSTLCLVKEISHGEILSSNGAFAFVNGQNDERHLIDKFNKKNLSILIGTTGVLGEGVDTKPAEYIIIAGLGKSKNGFMQQVGRGFRTYPGKTSCKIILIRDVSHKWTLAHFKAQCKYLKEEFGVVPIKIS